MGAQRLIRLARHFQRPAYRVFHRVLHLDT
jgi:hypothetical protein